VSVQDRVPAELLQADLDQRESLAQMVVQILGDPAALPFLGQTDLARQTAQAGRTLGHLPFQTFVGREDGVVVAAMVEVGP